MATMKDLRGDVSTWCPGCGHFSIMAGIQKAIIELGYEPHEFAIISGIGCSGKVSEYIRSNGFHTIHGRSLPVAQGVKIGNPELKVIASGGDGDGYGIGLGHFVHASRRNIDMSYFVMDNSIYGLTKGQTSPRSEHGFTTKAGTSSNKEYPVDPVATSIVNGATFVAQAYSGNIKELSTILKRAIEHRGFSHVNIFSPCVTFNKVNTYDFYKEHLTIAEKPFATRDEAVAAIRENNGLITGILFEELRDDFQAKLGIDFDMQSLESGEMDEQLLSSIQAKFQV
ncbi:thiamine pyrophosphate-dependent enzyme [Salisediminibacterium halotolerans]|uniref:thiamine pyrophosphate-dependent enzyme n=1 Tax=Salisediminibacterium halotolerans TaxID=517425 RepID=UPI000EAF9C02|nr:thiamine pyrophosphate-dependent enzyme [Salisediminibacterium halotolerans]RLJ73132.1 2-oxoglutarate ferredoxin oxidoreductase subunit beta [Actinophytocola xinjiangensis]RPE86554.1 2-oxoglutarate ferredoxin oxidoreductase subunit beta [Salisediminibacterium halotolerans]TWG33929.1 2-oxoglutarate ferredoxin oxidoreductase subunit beta [Salisediminibacterium halotolerans]GEL08855.1 2-oxoglutarate ferredoxin oxidoreductase subunit beta [Salisediminibacterium halotolerans]